MGMKTGGEIVQVQGGHVLRSTGRKDRHSKVFTAKGPRDRRVRLSAHTAIRFYDVQDRLGYDRPSKAVDWLIKKAKFAIDKLAELPPYYPIADGFACNTDPNDKPNEPAIGTDEIESGEYDSQLQRQTDSTFAPSLETFFPTSSATTSINFQGNPIDMILRPTNPAQDLGLSLHNFHDSRLFPSHTEEDTSPSPTNDQRLITDSIPAGYEAYQKMTGVNWNDARETDHAGLWLQPLLGQSSAAFSQRGTLQSSLTHSVPIRAWSSSNHRTHPNQLLLGTRFDGSSEFLTPSRIHGEGEENIVSGRHSSSPNYRH